MEKSPLKSKIEFFNDLLVLILIGIVVSILLILLNKLFLFIYIFIPILVIGVFFSLRRFYFLNDRIVVRFLYRKDIILLKDIAKIIYKYSGANGASPVLLIKNRRSGKRSFRNYYQSYMYQFVIKNHDELVRLLRYFKNKGIDIQIISTETYEKRLKNEIADL